jgi:hypothetical protein
MLVATKTLDVWVRGRERELGVAALVGKLEAGFGHVCARLDGLGIRVSEVEASVSDLRSTLTEHTQDEAVRWASGGNHA